ncbi:GHMP kinase [Flavobacteriaceae bacterium R38]|nr:GHMP kinase [Flavobacteriaceae bacterium R38]
MIQKEFYSHGKLLLSGEYVVLDEALSLAIPTTFGQSLIVNEVKEEKIYWTSLTHENNTWFEATIQLNNDRKSIATTNNQEAAELLLKILNAAQLLNPSFLSLKTGYSIITRLEFPQNWGLGSSSTLINNIAQWAQVDPYRLLWNSFSGSGYDIACARHTSPITYQLKDKKPIVAEVDFNPVFKDQLFFVHLNQKQNSREGILQYRKYKKDTSKTIERISKITESMIKCEQLSSFEELINEHETLIASIINLPKIKDLLFSDYSGSIKSLGAWGGDFILATGNDYSYFKSKGYTTIIPYSEMIKK